MNISFNGSAFCIDPSEIGTKSLSKNEILLPYSGDVPLQSQDDTVLLASVRFVVRIPFHPISVHLVVRSMHNGMSLQKQYLVRCSTEEIISILDRFFSDPNTGASGMDGYWEGFSQASYLAWKRSAEENMPSASSF